MVGYLRFPTTRVKLDIQVDGFNYAARRNFAPASVYTCTCFAFFVYATPRGLIFFPVIARATACHMGWYGSCAVSWTFVILYRRPRITAFVLPSFAAVGCHLLCL